MPVVAAGSMPILRNMMSMRRLPSLLRTGRSQAASPARPTLSAADSGSSEPCLSASGIACWGAGFQTGVCVSCRKPLAPYCASQVRGVSPTMSESEPADGRAPWGEKPPHARLRPT